jgi:hypothetical protein
MIRKNLKVNLNGEGVIENGKRVETKDETNDALLMQTKQK